MVLEIGTAEGDFANEILKVTQPRKLHLIDPWEFQDLKEYKKDPNNVSNCEAEERFTCVKERFREETELKVIEIYRNYSHSAISLFHDNCFDWIYIDGMHTFDAVIKDLWLYERKVKKEGFILGHDYANNPAAKQMNFDVVEAVNQFVKNSNWTFFGLTIEMFPTYILVHSSTKWMENDSINRMLGNLNYYIEINGLESKFFVQKIIKDKVGNFRLLYSIT